MASTFFDSFLPLAMQSAAQVGPAGLQGQIQGQDLAIDRRAKEAQIANQQAMTALHQQQAKMYGQATKPSAQMQALQFLAKQNPEQYSQMMQNPEFFMQYFGHQKQQPQFYNTAGGLIDVRQPDAPTVVGGTTKAAATTTDQRNASAMDMTLDQYFKYKGERTQANRLDPDAKLTPETTDFMARQLLAGDPSVLQNLGRGMQGGRNVTALRERARIIGEQMGMTPQQVALATGEFQGLKSAERTLGTRQANFGMAQSEAYEMSDLVLKTSEAFDRSAFPGVNKAIQFFEKQTGDVGIRQFGAAINSFINAYARAISPTGVPTVSDKDHAREILSTADSKESVRGLMDLLKAEMDAAGRAPGIVKQELRGSFEGKPGKPKTEFTPANQKPKMPVPSKSEQGVSLEKSDKATLHSYMEAVGRGEMGDDLFKQLVIATMKDKADPEQAQQFAESLLQKSKAKRP